MNSCRHLTALCLAILLSSCGGVSWQKAFSAHQLTLSYDDFGPERIASALLGPRGGHTTVIAHHGVSFASRSSHDLRYVDVQQAMIFLRHQVQSLPPTPANEPLRRRLRATYERLYVLHRRRYDTMLGNSLVMNQGGMNRPLILPPLLPPTI